MAHSLGVVQPRVAQTFPGWGSAALEMSDRHANAIATVIAEPGAAAPEIAQLQGIALGGVFQTIITEAGRRTALVA